MTTSTRLAAIFFVLLVCISGCSPLSEATLDELVDVGTHRLYIHCTGTGKPKIVIDTGLGETFEGWGPIIESLSRETRVCAYHRAGYGQSDPGPMPRDSQRAADELHLLLANSAEEGPFILVGHSLGALNMQVFAHSYPEEVFGLVLLDPSPLAWMMGEGFPELRKLFNENTVALREQADKAIASSDSGERATAAFMNTIASENEEFFGRTTEEVAGIQSFGDLQLIVIGATEPDSRFGEYAQEYRQFWNEESQRLTGKSESGRFVLAEGSGHLLYLDAPQLVIDVILEMLR